MVLIGFFVFEMIEGYFIGPVLSKESDIVINNCHNDVHVIVTIRLFG